MSIKRSRRIDIRLTEDELCLIKSLAKKSNMNISTFMLHAAFNLPITVYEVDSKALLRPLIGLQRHYNSIRYNLHNNPNMQTIINPKLEKELQNLWQLLAQAKQVETPQEV